MSTSNRGTGRIQTEPGFLVYYTLDELIRSGEVANPDEWGICGIGNTFWIGEQAIQGGEDVLLVPLSEILKKRQAMYPDLADEKIYVFAGIDEETDEFVWFLLNEERALPCIAPESAEQEATPAADAVVHQVLLADLNELAELWEISSDNLGLEINAEGDLVPKIIDEEDDPANLTLMRDLAEKGFPHNDERDLVVELQKTTSGVKMKIATMDFICSPAGRERRSRWWSFTDSYREHMN